MAPRDKNKELTESHVKTSQEVGGLSEIVTSESMEEVLELIWTLREEGRDDLEEVIEESRDQVMSSKLEELKQHGLLSIVNGKIILSVAGEKKAAKVIRRHRLAETLLSEVFDLEHHHVESNACQFEHILSARVTESVCTFLGHPQTCPHGKPIPQGDCCSKFQLKIKPLVQRLADFKPGEKGRIIFITPKQRSRLDRLSSLGLIPGSIIKLQQKQPSYVIETGNTLVALDSEIVKEIYIKALD